MLSKLNRVFGLGAFILWAFVAFEACLTMVLGTIVSVLGKKHEYTVNELGSFVILVGAAVAFSVLEHYTSKE
jgi:hypothetical protein